MTNELSMERIYVRENNKNAPEISFEMQQKFHKKVNEQ